MLFFDAPYMDTDSDELRLIIGLGRQLAAEVRRLREPESDEAWMRRVYPDHAWSPSDGMTYEQFCRGARSSWEADHAELKRELAALRERHAADVEAAFKDGWLERGLLPDCGMPPLHSCATAWLASEAKARLT